MEWSWQKSVSILLYWDSFLHQKMCDSLLLEEDEPFIDTFIKMYQVFFFFPVKSNQVALRETKLSFQVDMV